MKEWQVVSIHRYYRLCNRDMKQNRALHGYLYINNFGSVLLILSLRSTNVSSLF